MAVSDQFTVNGNEPPASAGDGRVDLFTLVDSMGVDMDSCLEVMAASLPLKDVLSLDGNDVERLFDFGHRAVVGGNYKVAGDIFVMLCQLNPLDARFPFALGVVYQLTGSYAEACTFYSYAVYLKATWVDSYLRLAECAIALGDLRRAVAAIGMAFALLDDGYGEDEMRARAELLSARISCLETGGAILDSMISQGSKVK